MRNQTNHTIGIWAVAFSLAGLVLLSAPGQSLAQEDTEANTQGDAEVSAQGDTEGSTQGSGKNFITTPFSGKRPVLLDAHVGVAWHWVGFVTGLRFAIPILHNGFIPKLNNAVYINFGMDFYWINTWSNTGGAMGFPVNLLWEFYFTNRWSAFTELGVNVFLPPSLFQGNGYHASAGNWIVAQVGGRFYINDKIALTARIGNPFFLFGATFLL
jgi:hypothetical protein